MAKVAEVVERVEAVEAANSTIAPVVRVRFEKLVVVSVFAH